MQRLFTALEIPGDVAGQLDLMRGGVPGARWIEPDCYHITLCFYGLVDRLGARDLVENLDRVSAAPFSIRLAGMGSFGKDRPHSIFARLEESAPLKQLQKSLTQASAGLAATARRRKFTPHVTLARLKQASPGDVERYVAAHNLFTSRVIPIQRFALFSSTSSRGGGPYALEETFRLGSPS